MFLALPFFEHMYITISVCVCVLQVSAYSSLFKFLIESGADAELLQGGGANHQPGALTD